ncbi:MAG: hypothetical protein LBH70_08905, partial [Spirochaetaceae bacterium]|nr:hypothetical protein [Spirochaetaceae bacterium]
KIDLFLYRDGEYTDLIAHTEVDLSRAAWETTIPSNAYGKVYFKLYIEYETGFSFTKAAGEADIPVAGKTGIVLSVTFPEPQIQSFSIDAAENG